MLKDSSQLLKFFSRYDRETDGWTSTLLAHLQQDGGREGGREEEHMVCISSSLLPYLSTPFSGLNKERRKVPREGGGSREGGGGEGDWGLAVK